MIWRVVRPAPIANMLETTKDNMAAVVALLSRVHQHGALPSIPALLRGHSAIPAARMPWRLRPLSHQRQIAPEVL